MLKSKLLASVALIAIGGVAQAAGVPKDIMLDGYCDGLHLVKTGNGGYAGTRTGCASQAVGGGKVGGNRAVVFDGFPMQVIVRGDGTWTYYNLAGGVVNSGTWTAGSPAAVARTPGLIVAEGSRKSTDGLVMSEGLIIAE